MSNLRKILAILSKEAIEFCPECKSIMNDEYCSNKNCDKSKDAEKQRKKDEKDRKRYELENITYDNGEVGDSVLIKFINNINGREYWSARERKAKYPDSWVETKIQELQRQLDTDDRRVPEEMRNDNKSGNTFSVSFEVYKGRGAFDHANNQLVELGDKAYHTMKKSPKNSYDPNLDRLMEDDELMVPIASFKRLTRIITSTNPDVINYKITYKDKSGNIDFIITSDITNHNELLGEIDIIKIEKV